MGAKSPGVVMFLAHEGKQTVVGSNGEREHLQQRRDLAIGEFQTVGEQANDELVEGRRGSRVFGLHLVEGRAREAVYDGRRLGHAKHHSFE